MANREKKRPVAFATGQGSRLQTRLRQTAGFLKTNQGRPTVTDQVRMEGRRPKRVTAQSRVWGRWVLGFGSLATTPGIRLRSAFGW